MSDSSPTKLLTSAVTADPEWQMHLGERFAFEGLLATLKPQLAIEIGRAEGGSLRRIAAHSGHVHSFDLLPESDALRAELDNVTFHTGDSSEQVPEFLAELTVARETVDFALVDGDHSAEGVKRDALALLGSPACRTTTIVFHDAANDDVRKGLEAVEFVTHPKVALAMLDFVPGFLVQNGHFAMEIWKGLGVVVLDDTRTGPPVVENWRYDSAEMHRHARAALEAVASPLPPALPPVPEAPPVPEPVRSGRLTAALAGGAAAAAAIAAGFTAGRRR